MKPTRIAAAALVALVVLVATACGSSDSSVPADAVAVVDGTPVTKAELDGLLARAKATYKTQKRAFPKAGTAEYQSLQTQAVAFLVQRAEYDNRGGRPQAGRDGQGDRRPHRPGQEAVVRRQPGEARQAAEGPGLHDREPPRRHPGAAALREDLRLGDEGRQGHRRRDREVLQGEQEPSTRRPRAATCATSSSRRRRRRTTIYDQLKAGANFAALAKKYSQDPGSKDNGGKLTIIRGPDRRAVRHDRVPADDEPDLAAGQDPVRLPRDPADLRRQAGRRRPR